jgi:hypothetical protein
MTTVKRVLVTFTQQQWELVRPLIGRMGRGDADTVRGIVVSWLFEKGLGTEPTDRPQRRER